MARVAAFVPDLLFGSHVLGALRAEGHESTLLSRLDGASLAGVQVLVIDLTAEAPIRIAAVEAAQATKPGTAGATAGPRTLAFYSHVETDVRALGEQAGFDLVIPRSRMAREGAALVTGLARSRLASEE